MRFMRFILYLLGLLSLLSAVNGLEEENEPIETFTESGSHEMDSGQPQKFDLMKIVKRWPRVSSFISQKMKDGPCRETARDLGRQMSERVREAKLAQASDDIAKASLCSVSNECIKQIALTIKQMIDATSVSRALAKTYLEKFGMEASNLEIDVLHHYNTICSSPTLERTEL